MRLPIPFLRLAAALVILCGLTSSLSAQMLPFAMWSRRGTSDPSYAGVRLLMHCDGSFGDVRGNTPTLSASPSIVASPVKFGSGACNFAGGIASFNAVPALGLGAQDFTLEFWMYYSTGSTVLWNAVGQYGSYGAIAITESVYFAHTDCSSWRTAISLGLAASQWNHVAVSRTGGTISVFRNGQLQGTYAVGAGVALCQGSFNTVGQYFQGSGNVLDDVRLTIGQGRYTTNFTPPTAPYPDF